MNNDDHSDHDVFKSDPAWAAVREARRAVLIGWISAVVNGLVVIVAVAAPFLQQIVEQQKLEAVHYQVKSDILRSIRLSLEEARDAVRPPIASKENEMLARPETVKSMTDFLDKVASDATQKISEVEGRYEVSAADIDIRRAVETLKAPYKAMASEAFLQKQVITYSPNQDHSIGQLRFAFYSTMRKGMEELRDARLIYNLNTENGIARLGPVIIASCRESVHRGACARPLGDWDKIEPN